MAILIRGGDVLLFRDDGVGCTLTVGLGLEAGSDCRIIELNGCPVWPGLVKAHFHSPVHHLKGWLDRLTRLFAHPLSP